MGDLLPIDILYDTILNARKDGYLGIGELEESIEETVFKKTKESLEYQAQNIGNILNKRYVG